MKAVVHDSGVPTKAPGRHPRSAEFSEEPGCAFAPALLEIADAGFLLQRHPDIVEAVYQTILESAVDFECQGSERPVSQRSAHPDQPAERNPVWIPTALNSSSTVSSSRVTGRMPFLKQLL